MAMNLLKLIFMDFSSYNFDHSKRKLKWEWHIETLLELQDNYSTTFQKYVNE